MWKIVEKTVTQQKWEDAKTINYDGTAYNGNHRAVFFSAMLIIALIFSGIFYSFGSIFEMIS